MRGAPLIGILLVLAPLAGCEPQPARDPSAPSPEPPARVPDTSWVPAYTPQQQALLTPGDHAVQARATRVLPDLDRFGYADNRPLVNQEAAVKFTAMVTKVLNDSPRFYALAEAPPGTANTIVQYGPPPSEPDGYKVLERRSGGLGELVAAYNAKEAIAAVEQGDRLAGEGDLPGAVEAYRSGALKAPRVPAVRAAFAGALAKIGKTSEAEAEYREVIGVDASFAPAQIGLAELAEKRGDLGAARRALIEGLAYHPSSKRGLELARRLGGSGRGRGKAGGPEGGWTDALPSGGGGTSMGRVQPFAIFLDVDGTGAIRVATGKSDAAQIYGGCRAIMRYEPDVREQFFKQPKETPYYLSVVEEVVCLEAALGAYIAGRGNEKSAADADLDQLLRVAIDDGLSGYAMFEILGQHRPERARAAPLEVHRAVASYVEHYVLGRREAAPEGIYTAGR
jgi:tetratricopeptide (TPR) repeat protein